MRSSSQDTSTMMGLPMGGTATAIYPRSLMMDPVSEPRRRRGRWNRQFVHGAETSWKAAGPYKKGKTAWTWEQMAMVLLVASFAVAAILGAYLDWHGHGHPRHHHTPHHPHHQHRKHRRHHRHHGGRQFMARKMHRHNGTTTSNYEAEDEHQRRDLWSWLFGGPDSSHTYRHNHHHHDEQKPHHRYRKYSNTARMRQQPVYPLSSYDRHDKAKEIPHVGFWDASHERRAPPIMATSKEEELLSTRKKTASVTVERNKKISKADGEPKVNHQANSPQGYLEKAVAEGKQWRKKNEPAPPPPAADFSSTMEEQVEENTQAKPYISPPKEEYPTPKAAPAQMPPTKLEWEQK